MDLKNLPWIGGRILLVIAQLFVLFACIAYIEFIYWNNIRPDKLVKETFTQTTCTVLQKYLATAGHVVHRYRANFLVSYTVNGIAYRSWVTGNGLDQAFYAERDLQEQALAQFDVNSSYSCWYNPETPQIAVLVLRHNWMSTLPLFVPSVLIIIVAYYLLKATLEFFGIMTYKTRKMIKEKKHRL